MLFRAWLLYWRKKRKFDRLNEYSIEVFGSYPDKAKSEALDSLLLWIGCASVTVSVFVLLSVSYTALGWLFFSILAVILIRRSRYRRK